jgi:hypothetical protein
VQLRHVERLAGRLLVRADSGLDDAQELVGEHRGGGEGGREDDACFGERLEREVGFVEDAVEAADLLLGGGVVDGIAHAPPPSGAPVWLIIWRIWAISPSSAMSCCLRFSLFVLVTMLTEAWNATYALYASL